MAKPRQPTVTVGVPRVETSQHFTDVDHVLARLNLLNEDFQQVHNLSADLASFYQESVTSRDELFARLQQAIVVAQSKSEELTVAECQRDQALATKLGELTVAEEQRDQALTAAQERLDQAVAMTERRSSELDAAIAEAKASTEYVTALGEMVTEDNETKWVETRQQLQHETTHLSQRLSDQVAMHAGEIQGANQAWRTQIEAANHAWQAQIEATNQTWRKQAEATNQGWQLAQAQQAEQWRAGLSRDMAERTGAATTQARLASKRAEELAEAIAQLSERHSASQKELLRQMAADCAAWQAATQSQAEEIAALRISITSLRKMFYGAGAVVLALLCIIAIFR